MPGVPFRRSCSANNGLNFFHSSCLIAIKSSMGLIVNVETCCVFLKTDSYSGMINDETRLFYSYLGMSDVPDGADFFVM